MEHLKKLAILYIFLALVIGIVLGALPWSKWFDKKNETVAGRLANNFRTNVAGNPYAKNGCQRGHVECCRQPNLAGCSEN